MGRHPARVHLRHLHVVGDRMETVAGDEGSAKFRQRRRGLAGAGLLPFPEGVDRFLHCLAWHVGISLDYNWVCW
jgi:hypothetical protein